MRCWFRMDGTLVVEAEHGEEAFAIVAWYDLANRGECSLELKPNMTLTYGPQPVELKAVEDERT